MSTGEIRYRNDGTTGADSFTYQLGTVENASTDTATVSITVNTVPLSPETNGTGFTITTSGVAGATSGDGSVACDFDLGTEPTTTRYHDGSGVYPVGGDRVHTASPITTANRFDGQDLFYKLDNNKSIKIDSEGRVMFVYTCSTDTGNGFLPPEE